MNVTYENNWEYTDIHIDLEVPYKENYQMRMLNSNDISGLMKDLRTYESKRERERRADQIYLSYQWR